jgi:ubiquinone/menaquinone biosynthesis C-methylase UbiE
MTVKTKQEAIYYNKKIYNGDFGDNWDSGGYVKKCRKKIMITDLKEILSNLNNNQNNKTKQTNLNLMDLGCGTGAMCLNFYRISKNSRIYPLDISENMINRLRKKLSKEDLKRTELIVSDAYEYLKKTKTEFDLIASSGAMHHFFDYLDVLDISCKRLRKGGYIYWDVEPKKEKSKKLIKNYLAKAIRTLDCSSYEFKKDKSPFAMIIYLYVALLNFFPFINQDKIINLEKTLLRKPKDKKAEDELYKSETFEEGLDLDEIIKILNKNKLKIIKISGGTASNFMIAHKLLDLFDINTHFKLITKKQ